MSEFNVLLEVKKRLPLIVFLLGFTIIVVFSLPRGEPAWIMGNGVAGGSGTPIPVSAGDLDRFPTMKKAMMEADIEEAKGWVHPEEYLECPVGEAKKILRFLGKPYSKEIKYYFIAIQVEAGLMRSEIYLISIRFSYEKPYTL